MSRARTSISNTLKKPVKKISSKPKNDISDNVDEEWDDNYSNSKAKNQNDLDSFINSLFSKKIYVEIT